MSVYSIKDIKLVNILERAEKDLQEMKQTQFVGRRVLATKISLFNKLVESVDFYGVPPTTPVGSAVNGIITFTAESQVNPYGRLILDFYDINGQKIVNPGVIGLTGQTPSNYNIVVTQVDDGKLSWTVQINGPPTHFFVRFSVAATDRGTVVFTNS